VQRALEEERRCLIEARPEGIEENTRIAGEFMTGIILLNSRFETVLVRTGKELGLPDAGSLSLVISGVDPEDQLQLRALQERCFSAAGAIKRLISMNEGLIKNSLEIIGRSISLFSRILGGGETYGAAGRILNGKSAAGIICREI
jgi:hypothetical protein